MVADDPNRCPRILYFDCFNGASGDMVPLSALVDFEENVARGEVSHEWYCERAEAMTVTLRDLGTARRVVVDNDSTTAWRRCWCCRRARISRCPSPQPGSSTSTPNARGSAPSTSRWRSPSRACAPSSSVRPIRPTSTPTPRSVAGAARHRVVSVC
ncbi:MAG: hypothetical protein HC774_08390 [Sphingomonadales bacterium]|nr:hypothetical protein [Sphingomonadales bacterium]